MMLTKADIDGEICRQTSLGMYVWDTNKYFDFISASLLLKDSFVEFDLRTVSKKKLDFYTYDTVCMYMNNKNIWNIKI